MASTDEGTWGCILAVVAVGFGAWWLWDNYEIKERAVDPGPAPPALISSVMDTRLDRPNGMIPVSSSDEGTIWFLDAETVKGDREHRQGWLVYDHSKDTTTQYRETKELWRVNCDTDAYEILTVTSYLPNGKVGATYTAQESQTNYAVPGSRGASALRELCHVGFDPVK